MANGITTYMATIAGFKGVPLLMHNGRLANPLDPATKALKAVTGKKDKTDETHEEIMRVEFAGAIYHDNDLGPYLPSEMVEACIKLGARMSKNGKKVEAGMFVQEDRVPLEYDGPRTVDGLFALEEFRSVAGVKVGRNRVVRTRPRFFDWKVTFTLLTMDDIVDEYDVRRAIEDAGRVKGIGDWRPRNGRFQLVEWAA